MSLYLSFVDFWQGHNPNNNILFNIIKNYIFDNVEVVDDPQDADVIFATVYGRNHKEVLHRYGHKTILWLGENLRPNAFPARFFISFDFASYAGKNIRMPLWLSEIDWFNSGIGVASIEDVKNLLITPGSYRAHDLEDRAFCITIFNNPEGTRLEVLRNLSEYKEVKCYGRPFGNWFPTYETYKEKLDHMGGYLLNLCPENSYYPGYYTEKCFHAKLAGCIPIYMADPQVALDFNPRSFINIFDFREPLDLISVVRAIDTNRNLAAELLNEPLLHSLPKLDKYVDFIQYAIHSILSLR